MIKAVICGSFRRDHHGLCALFSQLEACGVRVLAPLSIKFVDTTKEVVRTQTDEKMDIAMLELLHLRAIREADFVWLHAPGGYVGLSGSFEVGYSRAKSVPVFSYNLPTDVMLRSQVIQVDSVYAVLAQLKVDPRVGHN